MNEHPDEVYTVTGLELDTSSECIYILSGYMGDNNWAADELIHVPEAQSNFEVIKNMTMDEMVEELIPLITGLCEDGIPSHAAVKKWLSSKPE